MEVFIKEFLSGDDFGAVLAVFCCYDYELNAFEVIERIAANEKNNDKCSLCAIVCCIAAANHQ